MERDNFWDSLKFLLIFFVVYGHMIETYAPDGYFNRAMYNFIYIFHMPFFMFISGRFSQIRDRAKYKKTIVRLFETYLVFQTIRCVKILVISGNLDFVYDVLCPKGTLWYIAYLIIYRIYVYIFPIRYQKRYSAIILLSFFCISILWGYLPITIGQKLLVFFLYFLLGLYSANVDVKNICRKIPLPVALLSLFSIITIIYIYFNYNIGYVIYYDTSYFLPGSSFSSGVLCMARLGVYATSVMISLILMRIVDAWKFFPQYGSKTLFIYMYHTFIVLGLRLLIEKRLIIENELLLFLYTLAIIAGLVLLSEMRFWVILMTPFSYIKEYVISHKNNEKME